ncbi:MAG: hypothetical protein JWN62_3471, partial [Acidimicrobiales bacterium]|nr:hypothetical protein [Acidimicrobiales bacterium]
MARPDDLHEYLSFDDPDEERTWVFDTTFLRSNWNCIWGSGCKGVLTEDATDLAQGCCSYGAHFIDAADVQTVVDSSARLRPDQWQYFDEGTGDEGWTDTEPDGTVVTRVIDGACIFLNRPGFSGGAGCALHSAPLAIGERYIDWKPDVCWQLPLRLHEDTDAHGRVTSTLREWKRRDWGEGGEEFHWWCTESSDAFTGKRPVYQYLRDEIIEFTGQKVYDLLVKQLDKPRATPLPHPA